MNSAEKTSKQEGFMLLEVLAAGALLLVLTGCLALFARSAQVQEEDSCRVRAVFLAQAQLAEAEAAAEAGALHAGSLPWQGPEEDLQEGTTTYKVETEVGEETEENYQVHVSVAWSGVAGEGQVAFERTVTSPVN